MKCPKCGSRSTQALIDTSQCLECGAEWLGLGTEDGQVRAAREQYLVGGIQDFQRALADMIPVKDDPSVPKPDAATSTSFVSEEDQAAADKEAAKDLKSTEAKKAELTGSKSGK